MARTTDARCSRASCMSMGMKGRGADAGEVGLGTPNGGTLLAMRLLRDGEARRRAGRGAGRGASLHSVLAVGIGIRGGRECSYIAKAWIIDGGSESDLPQDSMEPGAVEAVSADPGSFHQSPWARQIGRGRETFARRLAEAGSKLERGGWVRISHLGDDPWSDTGYVSAHDRMATAAVLGGWDPFGGTRPLMAPSHPTPRFVWRTPEGQPDAAMIIENSRIWPYGRSIGVADVMAMVPIKA